MAGTASRFTSNAASTLYNARSAATSGRVRVVPAARAMSR
jgi:hypothetical protein